LAQLPPGRQLAAVRNVLGETGERGPQPRSALYTQLARHVRRLPPDSRADGFDAVLDAVIGSADGRPAGLPAHQRSAPLRELSDSFLWLPADRQPKAFRRITDQIGQLPTPQRDLLHEALTRQVHELAMEHRSQAFDSLVAALPNAALPGAPLMRLANIVSQLPEARQMTAFDRLIDATAPLATVARGEQLMQLARLGQHLPADRQAAFQSLLRAVGTLDQSQRGYYHTQLTWLIDQLPEQQREPFFHAILTAVVELPRQYRSSPLWTLTLAIDMLPTDMQLGAIRRLAPAVKALSAQQWDEALTALSVRVGPYLREQAGMFEVLAVAAATASNPATHANLLARLTGYLRSDVLPENRAGAWRCILQQAEALAPQAQAVVFRDLADRIGSLLWDDRADAFNRLVDALIRHPSPRDAGALERLIRNVALLPDNRQLAARARIAEAWQDAASSRKIRSIPVGGAGNDSAPALPALRSAPS
jgi:hypothetical protein